MAHGSFTNRANNDGDLSSDPGFIPDGAFGMRVGPVSQSRGHDGLGLGG